MPKILFLIAVVLAPVAYSQDPRASITGVVTDQSNAPVPGATLTARNKATGVRTRAVSNSEGHYDLLYLAPAEYIVVIEKTGFRSFSQESVGLRTGDRVRLDVQLEVGTVTDTITVTAQPPLLESATASVGQVISGKQAADMPLRSGSLSWLYAMAPGVVLPALPSDGPWNIDMSSALSVGGGGRYSADFNVDGVSNNSYGGRTAFVPPPDAVQEVRVTTTSYDAALGHTTGGSIEISLKSGTNDLHGAIGATVSSGPMQTRDFFTNKFIYDTATGPITPEKIKANTPSIRWLRGNVTAGGPVFVPKVYNGRNRTFWMFGWHGQSRSRPGSTVNTVPTPAQRNGDFSALLGLGSQYQIYDPFTTQPAASNRFQRQPLAGNIIPASRIDPAARTILKYFPEANTQGTRDFLNNYARTRQDTQELRQYLARIDHNVGERLRMFGRFTQSDFDAHFDEYISGSTVRGRDRRRPHRGAALDAVYVLSPSLVLDTRYGFTWFEEFQSYDNIGWDLREFGFPDSLIKQLDPRGISFPLINVNGFLQLGNDSGSQGRYYSHTALTVLNWTRGSHSLKAGWDFRNLQNTDTNYGQVTPRLDFGETYTRGPLDNSPVAPTGQGLASMLFGIPTGGYADVNDSRAETSRFHALFVHDDWRVSRRLTLNLGVRWEYESPVTERFNRAGGDFDFSSPNPIQAAAQTAYARSPIPEIAAANFRVLGGLTFVGVNGVARGLRPSDTRAFMPRFGYAYQVTPRVVARGGYGLYFGLLGADFVDVTQPGFNQRTSVEASNNNGVSYQASISNPLPFGLQRPPGAANGLTTFLGGSVAFPSGDGRRPYTQRWSQSIQWQPSNTTLLEIGYMGARGVRLRVPTSFNAIPERYLSASPTRDNTAINFLSANFPNPFRGINGFQGTALFTAANTTRGQLLRPFPQFTGLRAELPAGANWYNALTLRLERRVSRGLFFTVNYTWSKNIEAIAYRNETDSVPERVVSSLDRPHRIAGMATWELPSPATGWLSHAVNGWQLQSIVQMQSGPPLEFGNVIYNGTWDQLRLTGSDRSLGRWFNTSGFERGAQAQLASNVRQFPTRIGTVRSDGIQTVDLAVIKNFRVSESIRLQLRGEAEGAMNHPNFAPPNTVPTSSLFGSVTTTQTRSEERRIFVGLKLLF